MHKYPRVARFVRDQQWALLESKLDVICEIVGMRAQGITLSDEEIRARIGAATRPATNIVGGVALLPLYGVIAQKMNAFTAISGGTSLDLFLAQVRQALADPAVSALVLDIDSPGGSVFGVPEAAQEIFKARGTKPIVAVANPQIASAAYWIASAADEIVCMPSGEVGSIGVLAVHEDWSGFNEQAGVRPTYVYAGKYKTEFNPDEPLSDDARGYLQTQIDATYHDFVRFVAKGRGVTTAVVQESFGQGRMLLARPALAAKMVDRIDTLENTLARLTPRRGGRAAGADEPLRLAVDGELPTERAFERALQQAGFSARESEIIIAKGYREVVRGGAAEPPHGGAMSDAEAAMLIALVETGTSLIRGEQ